MASESDRDLSGPCPHKRARRSPYLVIEGSPGARLDAGMMARLECKVLMSFPPTPSRWGVR